MEIGWQLVRQEAPFERDYLLLSPSGNYRGCMRRELKYSVGAAVQAKILANFQFRQQQLFDHRVAHFWTPHSGRNFMPSASAAMGYQKSDRDVLGGWSAQGSDRYTRLARRRISAMQVTVAQSFSDKKNCDLLGEAESLQALEEHTSNRGLSREEVSQVVKALSSRAFVYIQRGENVAPDPAEELEPSDIIPDEVGTEVQQGRLDKRRRADIVRTQQLGSDPRSVSAEMRSTFEPGFYLSITGKKDTLILHRLGAYYAIPGLDYLRYRYLGLAMLQRSEFHQICQLCAVAQPMPQQVTRVAQRLLPRPQRKHRNRRVGGELANSTECRTGGSVSEAKRAGAETMGPKGRANQSQVSEKQEVFRRELASSKSLVKEWRAGQIPLLPKGPANESEFSLCCAQKQPLSWFETNRSPHSRVDSQFLLFANSYVIKMALKFVSKAPVTAEDLASAPELEPALESLLRKFMTR